MRPRKTLVFSKKKVLLLFSVLLDKTLFSSVLLLLLLLGLFRYALITQRVNTLTIVYSPILVYTAERTGPMYSNNNKVYLL